VLREGTLSADILAVVGNTHEGPCQLATRRPALTLTLDATMPDWQEVDKEVPDEKRKGKMKTIQELEYRYEPEMEGASSSADSRDTAVVVSLLTCLLTLHDREQRYCAYALLQGVGAKFSTLM